MDEQTKQAKAQQKREYMRAYMREYKAKKYVDDPESVRRINRSRYLAGKTTPTAEDKKKYGSFLHSVYKIKGLLAELSKNRPDLLTDILGEIQSNSILIV